ncbi:hypothetical protein RchiOBHm_Chr5g0020361 [Rosa chinensis]|uniref:Uncharacterized protein n=1 Tax=Rosa chinensis TaxID=74649 RepID=A0A2P6Q785_ROSCH|nr:hypothetical protein RchiOBHm_Chr5g0020361 [Rosa chinensis]
MMPFLPLTFFQEIKSAPSILRSVIFRSESLGSSLSNGGLCSASGKLLCCLLQKQIDAAERLSVFPQKGFLIKARGNRIYRQGYIVDTVVFYLPGHEA